MTVVITIPLLGWDVAVRHAIVACTMAILLVEVLALTISHIPFTQAYPPGHARLRTRWWVYALGLYAFAYLPARVEPQILEEPAALLGMVACIAAVIGALEVVGRRRVEEWPVQDGQDAEDDLSSVTVLNLGGAVRSAVDGH